MPVEFCKQNGCVVARFNEERMLSIKYKRLGYMTSSPDIIIKHFFAAHRHNESAMHVFERINKVGVCIDCDNLGKS